MVAVVLAGGTSRRFGTDKLAADLDGRPLLWSTVASVPPDWPVIMVGPAQELPRAVTWVREDPVGGGPAAALVAGVRAAAALDPSVVVTLPGDAPAAGRGAVLLVGALEGAPGRPGAVAVDEEGRAQPLQLALRPAAATALLAGAGADGAAGASARRLISGLGLAPVPLPADQRWDVDTPEQLDVWRRLFR